MPRPDFRALCAELLAELEDCFTISKPAGDPLIQRAHAALAQPAPEPPTDEAIIEFWCNECAGDGDAGIIRLARWGQTQPAPEPTFTDEELKAMWRDLERRGQGNG